MTITVTEMVNTSLVMHRKTIVATQYFIRHPTVCACVRSVASDCIMEIKLEVTTCITLLKHRTILQAIFMVYFGHLVIPKDGNNNYTKKNKHEPHVKIYLIATVKSDT